MVRRRKKRIGSGREGGGKKNRAGKAVLCGKKKNQKMDTYKLFVPKLAERGCTLGRKGGRIA